MRMHCADGWLFHEWKNNKCTRCDVTYRGTLTDVTLADDPYLSASHVQVHPVDPASPRDSVSRPLQLVPVHHDEDDSSSAAVAFDHGSSVAP